MQTKWYFSKYLQKIEVNFYLLKFFLHLIFFVLNLKIPTNGKTKYTIKKIIRAKLIIFSYQKRNIKSYLLMDKEKGFRGLISKTQFDDLITGNKGKKGKKNQKDPEILISPSDYVDIVKYALKNGIISKADDKVKQKLCQPHFQNPDKIPPPHRLLDHMKETLCSLIEAHNDEDLELVQQQQKELNESILFFEAQNPPNTYQTLIDFQLKGSDEFYIEKQLIQTRLLKVKKEIKNKASQLAKKNQQIEAQKKKEITEKSSEKSKLQNKADKSFQKKQKPSQINLSNEKKSQQKIEQKEESQSSQSENSMNGKITFEKIELVQQKRQQVQKTSLMKKQEDQKAQKIKKLFLFQRKNQQEAKQ